MLVSLPSVRFAAWNCVITQNLNVRKMFTSFLHRKSLLFFILCCFFVEQKEEEDRLYTLQGFCTNVASSRKSRYVPIWKESIAEFPDCFYSLKFVLSVRLNIFSSQIWVVIVPPYINAITLSCGFCMFLNTAEFSRILEFIENIDIW